MTNSAVNKQTGVNGIFSSNSSILEISSNLLHSSLLLAVYLFLIGCSTTQPPVPVVDREKIDSAGPVKSAEPSNFDQLYTVQKGDTLYGIALKHGVDFKKLVEWNEIVDPKAIQPGQKIRLSMPEKSAQPTLFALPQQPVTTTIESAPQPTGTTINLQESNGQDAVDSKKVKTSPKALKLPYSEQNATQSQYPANNLPPQVAPVAAVPENNSKIEVASPQADPPQSGQAASSPAAEWMWPATGKLLASFSKNSKGVKISGQAGQPIFASAAGEVVYSGHGLRGYGNLIIIKHDNTFLSAYAHNSKLLVKEGEAVVKGQKIAEMGNTDTDTIQLHFEIRKNGKPVDPLEYLPNQS